MNKINSSLIVIVATVAGSSSLLAGELSKVKLQAKTSSMGRSTDKKWSTSWGSYDKDIFRARAIAVSLLSEQSGTCVVDCYWVVSKAGKRSKTVIKDQSQTVDLTTNSKQKLEFGKLFVENDTRYNALGISDKDGYKYKGWVIRVSNSKGKTLAAQGARPPMVNFVANWLKSH